MKKIIRNEVSRLSPYIAGKPIEEVKRELGLDKVVKLASNENPYGPSKKAIEALINTVSDTNIYPDSISYSFKTELSKMLNIKNENIFCGAGSDSLIKDICLTFIKESDESIMGEITFPRYKSNVILSGGEAIEIPMKDNALDIEKMVEAITSKTKIIWFCNPNNPTGTLFTKTEFMKVLDKIPEDVIIVMDEAYMEFKDTLDVVDSLELMKTRKNVIVLRTFSKAYGLASLRFGYGIASEEIVEYLNRVINPFDSNLFAQNAALEALKDSDYLNKVVSLNKIEREYFMREFKKMGLKYLPSHTNFIMVNVNGDDKPIYEYLLKNGFIVRPGFLLGMEGWLRISFGKEEDNKELIDLLEEAINERDN